MAISAKAPAGQGNSGGDKVNIDAYIARIGYDGTLAPTLETLQRLHLAHVTHIPFENLDVLLGRPIRLDLESLQAKLVAGGRGGYCFEHNLLFAAVLESLGFRFTRLIARVRTGKTKVRPRTHMLLSVEIEGDRWLADVGFGMDGMLFPLRFRYGEPAQQGVFTFRVNGDGSTHLLQALGANGWLDLYSFTLEPQFFVDYEVANHFTSTHPRCPFTYTLVVQRIQLEQRWGLRNREFIVDKFGKPSTRTLLDDEGLLSTLAQCFGLRFPDGTRFPFNEHATDD